MSDSESDIDISTFFKRSHPLETPADLYLLPQANTYTPLERELDNGEVDSQNEKAIHRIICYLAAEGNSAQEIAAATNYHIGTVYKLLRSERSRTLIAKIISDTHKESVADLLKGGAVEAVLELRKLSTGAKSEAVRMHSCKDILDRVEGRAVPSGEKELSKQPESPEEELKLLKAELLKLQNNQKKIG